MQTKQVCSNTRSVFGSFLLGLSLLFLAIGLVVAHGAQSFAEELPTSLTPNRPGENLAPVAPLRPEAPKVKPVITTEEASPQPGSLLNSRGRAFSASSPKSPGAALKVPGGKPSGRYTPGLRAGKGTAALNFSDAKLENVIMTISQITGENFILSPEVSGRKISIRTTKPVQKSDVFGIFEAILQINGLAAVRKDDYYTIVKAEKAKQHRLDLFIERDPGEIPRGDAMISLLVPIRFISANDIVQILKPTLSPGGNIAHYPKANTLIISDVASNIKKSLDIINMLDVDLFKKLNTSIIHINSVDVLTLNKELQDIFKILGYTKETGQIVTIPIERFNSLIVFSSSKELFESAREWIGQLDRESSSDEVSIHIYYVKNDKASNVKSMLDKLFGGDRATDAPKGSKTTAKQTGAAKDSKAAPAKKGSTGAPASVRSTDMDIFVYEPSNAIIVRSSYRDYQNLLKTIRELDEPPKQVLIDALVVEVALDDSTKYGLQWSAITGNVSTQNNTGMFSSTVDDPKSAVSTPIGVAALSGLNVLTTDAKNFFTFLQAFASDGKVNVLSNPHILVQNYAKASISVGSDEPIATQSTQTAVTTTASIIQSIEYRRTGIILTVSPQITEGDVVAMTIRQEISDVSTSRVVGDGTFPSFTKREAETSVVVRNGETIAIGGLIDTKDNKTVTAIPVISRIPLLGNLFKFTSITKDRTELLILLTPRVISNFEDASTATDELRLKLKNLTRFMDRKLKEDEDK